MYCFYFCSQCHSQSALAVHREGSRRAAWADPIMDRTGSLKTLFTLPGELFKSRKLFGLHWGHEKGCSLYVDQGKMSNAHVTVSIFLCCHPALSFISLFIFFVGFGSLATNFVLRVFLSSYLSPTLILSLRHFLDSPVVSLSFKKVFFPLCGLRSDLFNASRCSDKSSRVL